MFDYEIKIAKTEKEKKAAFKLRFDVFKKELGNKKEIISEIIETDIYDKFCDHLIIIDKRKKMVVGTYRLLLGTKVSPKIGFYAEKFFNMDKIKRLGLKQILELSRSCVHKEYREGLVINLLWNGIAKYTKDKHTKYLFGSVRLNNKEPKAVSRFFSMAKQYYYTAKEYRVYPLKNCAFKLLDKNLKVKDYKKIFLSLPPLVKGYLRLGVKICGPPAWNYDFRSIVFFILLDIDKMAYSYKRHFLNL